jgi:NAD(P)H-binding
MKVLLLGVTGRVGSRMLPALLKHGHEVVVYVRSANKTKPEIKSLLAGEVVGSATDIPTLKNAILTHNCDAVFNAAGLAPLFTHSKNNEFSNLFASVVKAVVEARKERGGPPIRAWFLSGWSLLDSPNPPKLIIDYVPLYPEHRTNMKFIMAYPADQDIAWSLFCASNLPPKYDTAQNPAPADCSGDNLVAKADSPPEWKNTLRWLPLIGTFLNIGAQVQSYYTGMEESMDFIAADFEKGLQSEFIGKRVGLKPKAKAG